MGRKAKGRSQSLPNIKRIDSATDHGWQVHFSRNRQIYTKYFSDKKYGAKKKALQEAISYRDDMLTKLPPSVRETGSYLKARSNTGHLGITLTFSRRKNGMDRQCFSVSARIAKGVVKHKTIWIDGDYDKKLKEAVAWRNEVLEERRKNQGLPPLNPKKKTRGRKKATAK